jgi:hypothetical protein
LHLNNFKVCSTQEITASRRGNRRKNQTHEEIMLKFKKEHIIYAAGMTAAFITLDVLGVSHVDKLAISALFGILAPLYFPRIAARVFSRA